MIKNRNGPQCDPCGRDDVAVNFSTCTIPSALSEYVLLTMKLIVTLSNSNGIANLVSFPASM